jgi:xanthine dehydrogenase large subunit
MTVHLGAVEGQEPMEAVGQPTAHESARAQVTGEARYIDDIPELKNTLYAAPILSPYAYGDLISVEASAAVKMAGVKRIILADDIPGSKNLASSLGDEPIFAHNQVLHIGQVIGLVIADSMNTARRAAKAVKISVNEKPAVLDVWQAIEQRHFVLPPVHVARGNAQEKIKRAANVLEGHFSVGGQEHFYLEGQVAYACPQEQGQWLIYSSTQHPGEVQHWVAHALGIESHAIRIECRRMGGGFGGKETQAGQPAVWAAIAAMLCNAPVKLRLDRDDDFMITGKRHPFHYRYRVGFDQAGLIQGLEITMAADCGFSADLSGPVADRAIFHVDNAYFLSDVQVHSYRCKTHRQSQTAFRGFGGPQGMMAIETIIGDIGRHLKIDPLDVRKRNLYGGPGRDETHYGMRVEDAPLDALLVDLEARTGYRNRRERITAFNQSSQRFKRGIAITPVKFGISFTATQFNQAGALVHVYTDGSILVNHGGTEMGQGLHTKVCQVVAQTLGVSQSRVRITASDTSKIPNASATAASSGTDLNAMAAHLAALEIRKRLASFYAELHQSAFDDVVFSSDFISDASGKGPKIAFEALIRKAYAARIQLWSDGFYKTPKIHYDRETLSGRPFFYFSLGAACSEVEIDTLTGEMSVTRVEILHDVGTSINPAIDIGQIEGGFIQGMGWLTTEELVWNAQGRLTTHAPSTYKIPAVGDTPKEFRVWFWSKPNTEDTIYRSKAVGEPPLMLAISVWEAIRDAVGQGCREPVVLDAPATPERIFFALRRGTEFQHAAQP